MEGIFKSNVYINSGQTTVEGDYEKNSGLTANIT